MMTQRRRLLAVVGALALLGATLASGSGYSDDHVDTSSVTILPGPLAAILTWVSFEEQSGGTTVEDQDGNLVLRVLDERGHPTGWNVSISTTDYPGAGSHLRTGQLGLSPAAVSIVRGNPDVEGHATFSVDPVGTRPSILWSVPNLSGDGEYDLLIDGTLGMPGDQHSNGPYIVIVNIDGGAP